MAIELKDRYQQVVNHFGGQCGVVEAFKNCEKPEKLAQGSVSDWVTGRSKMRPRTAALIQFLSNGKFKAIDLCPELKEVLDLIAFHEEYLCQQDK